MTFSASVGIVGAGAITRSVHLPVLKNTPAARIAWVADLNADAARDVASMFGVPHANIADPLALPACDIALLAVPIHARERYLHYFAGARTAVLAEKPFAISTAEHEAHADLFRGIPIACGYMRRSYAVVRALRRMVRSRWFGELRSIRYREGARTTRTEAGSSTLDLGHRLGGGALRDVGCHGIDVVGFISGARDFSVHECRIEWDGATDRHVEAAFSLLATENEVACGCTVDYTISWLLEQPNTIELHFDRASVRAGTRPDGRIHIASRFDFSDAIAMDLAEPGARTAYQAFFLQWQAVLDALRDGTESEYSARNSLWSTRLIEALYVRGGTK